MTPTATKPRRASRPAGPPAAGGPVCCCCRNFQLVDDVDRGGHPIKKTVLMPGPGRPCTIGTFRDGELIAIERRHWAGRDKCPLPTEHLDPTEWFRS
jgi:hypothetical protein